MFCGLWCVVVFCVFLWLCLVFSQRFVVFFCCLVCFFFFGFGVLLVFFVVVGFCVLFLVG